MFVLALVASLQAKHMVCDFWLQFPFMYRNKGKYGHPGGMLHAGLHGAGTAVILLVFGVAPQLALLLVLAEIVVHYHIDWAKERFTALRQFTPADAGYWVALGIDQTLHQWTYVVLVALVTLS